MKTTSDSIQKVIDGILHTSLESEKKIWLAGHRDGQRGFRLIFSNYLRNKMSKNNKNFLGKGYVSHK